MKIHIAHKLQQGGNPPWKNSLKQLHALTHPLQNSHSIIFFQHAKGKVQAGLCALNACRAGGIGWKCHTVVEVTIREGDGLYSQMYGHATSAVRFLAPSAILSKHFQ